MTTVKVDGFNIETLTADNWLVWASDVESVLTLRGCRNALDPEAEKVAAAKVAEALAVIRLTVSTSDKLALKEFKTATEAWEHLKTRYKDISKARCLQLKRELATLSLQEGETIDEMVGRGRSIMEQLVAAGLKCEEEDVVRAMLGGLPEAYDSLAVSMLTTDDELTFSEVLPKLYVVERRRKPMTAFLAEVKTKRGPKCWKCGEYGHLKSECTSKGVEGSKKGKGDYDLGHGSPRGKADPVLSF